MPISQERTIIHHSNQELASAPFVPNHLFHVHQIITRCGIHSWLRAGRRGCCPNVRSPSNDVWYYETCSILMSDSPIFHSHTHPCLGLDVLVCVLHMYRIVLLNHKKSNKKDTQMHSQLSELMTLMISPKHWAQAESLRHFCRGYWLITPQPTPGPDGFHQVTPACLGTYNSYLYNVSKYIKEQEIQTLSQTLHFAIFPNFPVFPTPIGYWGSSWTCDWLISSVITLCGLWWLIMTKVITCHIGQCQCKQSLASDWLNRSVPRLWLADWLQSVNNQSVDPGIIHH